MGPRRKAKWFCPNCKAPSKKSGDVSEPDESGDETFSAEAVPVDMKQMMEVMGRKFEMMGMKMEKMFTEADVKATKKFDEFIKTMNYYGDKVEDAGRAVKSMEQKLITMEKRLDKSEAENRELKTRLRNMEIQMNELAQKEFNTQIEIIGVKDKNINAEVAVGKILEKAGFASGEKQIKVKKITKPGESGHEKTTISVMFRTQEDRNEVLTKIKKERVYTKLGNTVNSDMSPISINEALCPYYKKIFFEVNKIKKDKKYAFLWTRDGKILLKKTTDANIMRISCMEDIGKL